MPTTGRRSATPTAVGQLANAAARRFAVGHGAGSGGRIAIDGDVGAAGARSSAGRGRCSGDR